MENENLSMQPIVNDEELEKDLFKEVNSNGDLHDQAFETKPVSFLRDSFNRFAKNKASIVGAAIILIIALYGIIVPFVMPTAHVDTVSHPNGFEDTHFQYATPYCSWFAGTGFWDGTKTKTVSEDELATLTYDDSNHPYYVKTESVNVRTAKVAGVTKTFKTYTIRYDTYAVGSFIEPLSPETYEALKEYDTKRAAEGKPSVIRPLVDYETYLATYEKQLYAEKDAGAEGLSESTITTIIGNMRNHYATNPSVYYALTAKSASGAYNSTVFTPVLENGKPVAIYKTNADGSYAEPVVSGGKVSARVDYYDYFTFVNGFEPRFLFGTNGSGQDIFLRLAQGTRFSLLLGVVISAINFVIGLIWGAVSGYYGGYVDLTMERITDIISNIPSIIILTICSIQFTNNVGLKSALGETGIVVLAFLIAFVYSGWIGVAGTTRMQFYRFKGQEYVLASRTLGAKDSRLIFRHILPNAIGTLVTSSVLMIPSVIFSESTLSFLGIVDFSKSNLSSIGTLLSEGQNAGLSDNPHVLLFPCIIISLLMICFNLFGNGLRDAFNTSLKGADD